MKNTREYKEITEMINERVKKINKSKALDFMNVKSHRTLFTF